MTTLEFSHNSGLVVASFLIALVAGFTGLTLTKDLSQKSFSQRKIAVSLASVALGGGIWSMHFVAMLGLQMPILFYYDAAITLASALLAILIVGVALGLLHFFERKRARIVEKQTRCIQAGSSPAFGCSHNAQASANTALEALRASRR